MEYPEQDTFIDMYNDGVLAQGVTGYRTFAFTVPVSGWYEFGLNGWYYPNDTDTLVDGILMERLDCGYADDSITFTSSLSGFTRGNFYLEAGTHTLTIRRAHFNGEFPSNWQLKYVEGSPGGSMRAHADAKGRVEYANTDIEVEITGGTYAPTSYEIWAEDMNHAGNDVQLATVSFEATYTPIKKAFTIQLPGEGQFRIYAKYDDVALPTSNLDVGQIVGVDSVAPAAAEELVETLVVSIDAVSQTITNELTQTSVGAVLDTNYFQNTDTQLVTTRRGAATGRP